MRSVIFFPLAALAAAALVALSLGPNQPLSQPSAQAGRMAAQGLVFDAEALTTLDPGPTIAVFADRTVSGRALGLRLAASKADGDVRPDEPGARLLLAPETAALLATGKVRVTLNVRPLATGAAPELAVRLETAAGPGDWVRVAIPLEPAPLVLEFAPRAAPTALALRPLNPALDTPAGFEVHEIRLEPIA